MRLLVQFNALIWSWSETGRAVRRGTALSPFILYAVVQAAVVFAVAAFAYPPFSAFVAPALRWRFGEAALHYPNNLFLLRPSLGQADTVLWVFLGAVLSAAAVRLFAARFAGGREGLGAAWSAGLRRYFPLVVVAAIVTGATHLVSRLPFTFWQDLAESSPSRFRLIRAASVAVVIALEALFVYVPPFLVLSGRRLGPALAGSFSLALRAPVVTYLLVGVPAALELLPLWLSRQSSAIAYRLSPELLIFVMAVWIVVILVAAYITIGGTTRFFLHATQDEAEPEGTEVR
jgi:hypothetical protein